MIRAARALQPQGWRAIVLPHAQEGTMTEMVVLEVRRKGRRPRYHRGARVAGSLASPEQCNMDQVALDVTELPYLPPVRRPRSQLCRRCFRGHPLLAAAAAEPSDPVPSEPWVEG